MKRQISMSIAICMLLSFAPSAKASWRYAENTLKEDYNLLKKEYRDLVREREEYEKKLEKIMEDRRLVTERFRKCTSERWRVIWQKQMNRVEEERKKLENERVKLSQFNGELGNRNIKLNEERQAIEDSHKIKGKKYDSEFRNWMIKFDTEYSMNIKELFIGYEEYMSGSRIYISFIDGAIKKCQNNDYMEPVTEVIIDLIPEIASAVKSLADILKKDR